MGRKHQEWTILVQTLGKKLNKLIQLVEIGEQMKKLILILGIVTLVAVGCSKSEAEKLAGNYQATMDNTYKLVLHENGKSECGDDYFYVYENGPWKIVEKEVHIVHEPESLGDEKLSSVYKIESNGDLTWIAEIVDGKRREYGKDEQSTYRKYEPKEETGKLSR